MCQQVVVAGPPVSDRDASLREIASRHLGSPHALDDLRRLIEPLPKDRALIVFGPGQDWGGTEVYLLASCLAWPRPVWFVAFGRNGKIAPELSLPPPPGIAPAALAFFEVPPPPEAGNAMERVGSKFCFIRQEPAP